MACRRGPRCPYLASGTCLYFHPRARVPGWQGAQGGRHWAHGGHQWPQGGHQWAQGGKQGAQGGWQGAQGGRQGAQGGRQGAQGGRQGAQGVFPQKACRDQEDCRRVPYCPFKHYNEDFPSMPDNEMGL